jgi:hypothetical protein
MKDKKLIKEIERQIEYQEKFEYQIRIVTLFLKGYKNNPKDFRHLFGLDVWKHYHFEESYNNNNPFFVMESLNELALDIVRNHKSFKFESCGIFEYIKFKKTKSTTIKNDKFLKELDVMLRQVSEGEWAI